MIVCNRGVIADGGSSPVVMSFQATATGTLTASVDTFGPDPVPGNDSASKTVTISPLRTDESQRINLAVKSHLSSGSLPVAGQLVLNDSQAVILEDAGSEMLMLSATTGRNRVDAVFDSASPAEWRVDFTGAAGFDSGSLRVQSGNVRSLGGSVVVFAVGGSNPPIKFEFGVSE